MPPKRRATVPAPVPAPGVQVVTEEKRALEVAEKEALEYLRSRSRSRSGSRESDSDGPDAEGAVAAPVVVRPSVVFRSGSDLVDQHTYPIDSRRIRRNTREEKERAQSVKNDIICGKKGGSIHDLQGHYRDPREHDPRDIKICKRETSKQGELGEFLHIYTVYDNGRNAVLGEWVIGGNERYQYLYRETSRGKKIKKVALASGDDERIHYAVFKPIFIRECVPTTGGSDKKRKSKRKKSKKRKTKKKKSKRKSKYRRSKKS